MDIILSPIITEKSMNAAGRGRFTFKVALYSRKEEIKREVENKFKVNVIDIATMVVKGKMKRTGQKRMEKQTQSYKKAIVALKAGQKIDIFEAGEKK